MPLGSARGRSASVVGLVVGCLARLARHRIRHRMGKALGQGRAPGRASRRSRDPTLRGPGDRCSPLSPGGHLRHALEPSGVPPVHSASQAARLLSDTGDERLVYEQVAVPLARDRDYTVRLRKRVDAAAQRYEILFDGRERCGPSARWPPRARAARSREAGPSSPTPTARDRVLRYDLFTEPGGAIPAWMANRAQREAAADLVHRRLKRAQENEVAGSSGPRTTAARSSGRPI